jgi:hypothetical protein
MRLFSYVVARDFGFAPNPFGGVCTLATCKPDIRRTAQIGDWIAGTSSTAGNQPPRLVYVMLVSEAVSFEQYWADVRFQQKKPDVAGSNKRAFGDNIYFKANGAWKQVNSHHSLPGGRTNTANIARDTKTNRVLVASQYWYWGGTGPAVPARFRSFGDYDVCKKGPGHKNDFPPEMMAAFIKWVRGINAPGLLGRPRDWP